jgi:hypothetical protein
MGYLEDSAKVLQSDGFEGTVPYMYRDCLVKHKGVAAATDAGNVTVGVGQLLRNERHAAEFPFLHPNGEIATREEIFAEFKRVHGMEARHKATYYYRPQSLILSDDTIKALLMKRLEECDALLRGHYAGYDEYPAPAKMALLDMIYNLGPLKLFGEFRMFDKYVNARDWDAVAAQCHRKGISNDRNAWTAHQFMLAEVKKPLAELTVHPAHSDSHAMLPGPPVVKVPVAEQVRGLMPKGR